MNGVKGGSCELEVVSPLFLAGADQGEAELRTASIRGVLRFWFRAMMGGLTQGDWTKVASLEAAVFGNTERASRVRIRVVPIDLRVVKPDGPPVALEAGFFYLGFPFYQWAGRGQYRLLRAYFEPGSAFRLDFSLRPGPDGELLERILWGTLWLWTHMGGLGARSRRGFGGVQVRSETPDLGLKFKPPPKPLQLVEHFRGGLRWIESAFREFAERQEVRAAGSIFTPSDSRPPFSSLAKWRAVLVTRDNWDNWQGVLADLGRFIRCFRNQSPSDLRRPTPDYSRVVAHYLPIRRGSRWLLRHSGVASWDLTNDAFGLPIQFRSSSRRLSATLTWRLENEDYDRRASPLMVRLLRLEGQYVVVLLLLESEFLPSGAVEWLKPTGGWPSSVPMPDPREIPPADLGVLHRFLDEAKKTFDCLGELP